MQVSVPSSAPLGPPETAVQQHGAVSAASRAAKPAAALAADGGEIHYHRAWRDDLGHAIPPEQDRFHIRRVGQAERHEIGVQRGLRRRAGPARARRLQRRGPWRGSGC
jgi:hypothetical protein